MKENIKNALLILAMAVISVSVMKVSSRLPYNTIAESESVITEAVPQWTLLSDDTVATVYNAVPEQCNDDSSVTASLYRINMTDVLSDRIIAMERTMMKQYGISYGDRVLVEGAGRWDGVWQVQDTMNRRFAGQHKIDFLVPNRIRHGKWKNVRVYSPANEAARNYVRTQI